MTLDTAVSKALYLGNGTARRFPLDFKVWDASELLVSVSGNGRESRDVTAQCDIELTDAGGIVTYPRDGAPLPEGSTLSIVRNMPFTQGIDLVSASRFDPQVIEDGLDQATAERQQLLEQLSRAVILPPTSQQSPEQIVESIYKARDDAGQSANLAAAAEAGAAESAGRACDCADTAATEADRAKTQADRAQSLVEMGPASRDKNGWVRIGQGIDVTDDGLISVEIPAVPLASAERPGLVRPDNASCTVNAQGMLSVNPYAGYLTEFRNFFEQTPPPGWAVRNGAVLENADSAYPALWVALHEEKNAWKCRSLEEWLALSTAAGGCGGAPFFVLDEDAKTIKLPDTRGDYERDAGSSYLEAVGAWHNDRGRNITGTYAAACYTASTSGVFIYNSGTTGFKFAPTGNRVHGSVTFDASVIWGSEHTGSEFSVRSIGILPCVCIGI